MSSDIDIAADGDGDVDAELVGLLSVVYSFIILVKGAVHYLVEVLDPIKIM